MFSRRLVEEAARTRTCAAAGCAREGLTKGYCQRHYKQWHKYGRLTPEREYTLRKEQAGPPAPCRAPDCQQTDLIAKGLCWRHYQQVRRHGKFIEKRG